MNKRTFLPGLKPAVLLTGVVALLGYVMPWSVGAFQIPVDSTGLGYTNYRIADVPLSIHVVQVARSNALYEIHSVHAGKTAVGLDTLSDQVALVNSALGSPVAAINGDFYQRDRGYAGAPRGLQVVDGELISGPSSKIGFWIDVTGDIHASNVVSVFHVTWPDGTSMPFRLNAERPMSGVALYTPSLGGPTRTYSGRELVLERGEGSAWLPLRLGKTYNAVVKEVRDRGDSPVKAGTMVLSIGPGALRRVAEIQPGAVLKISTATMPALQGVKTALSGGPILVRNGRRVRVDAAGPENYEYNSMFERHPRAAIGWNDNWFYMVEVDGRQRGLSIGMTLDDLAAFMVQLGCQEALNFDGGGSATLWYDGEVRNSPADRAEREIANCLVVVKKNPEQSAARTSGH